LRIQGIQLILYECIFPIKNDALMREGNSFNIANKAANKANKTASKGC
jgi:hypothetical protein